MEESGLEDQCRNYLIRTDEVLRAFNELKSAIQDQYNKIEFSYTINDEYTSTLASIQVVKDFLNEDDYDFTVHQNLPQYQATATNLITFSAIYVLSLIYEEILMMREQIDSEDLTRMLPAYFTETIVRAHAVKEKIPVLATFYDSPQAYTDNTFLNQIEVDLLLLVEVRRKFQYMQIEHKIYESQSSKKKTREIIKEIWLGGAVAGLIAAIMEKLLEMLIELFKKTPQN